MIKLSMRRLGLKLALLATLAVPGLASAQQYFTYNHYGDVLAGFRQTGSYAGNYELVVNFGNITNFIALPVGTTITMTNLNPVVLTNPTNAFTSEAQIQWSVFAAFPGSSSLTTPVGTFPKDTLWYTLPGTNVSTQTTPPARITAGAQSNPRNDITGCGDNGAADLSPLLGNTNVDNNAVLVREPVSYASQGFTLSDFISDPNDSTLGDFGVGGSPLPNGVENDTGASFTSAQRSDFYQACPTSSTDPLTGQTSGNCYLIGYFLLYPNGTMTFTRQLYSTPAPVAGFYATPTSGSAPLPVAFVDASTGSITNYVWNFGDGTIITNTTSANANHTYTAAGSYTVTETVYGPGGSNADVATSYIVVSSASGPVAGFSGTPTLGFAPLKVVFTDASTGTITNYLWTFGDGHSVTNATSVSVTNTYASAGSYTVTETVTGAGVSSTNKQTNYIVVSAAPSFSSPIVSGTNMVFLGTGGPVGVQYRILTSTNLASPIGSWMPVVTNTVSSSGKYGYTNSTAKAAAYFLLVSP